MRFFCNGYFDGYGLTIVLLLCGCFIVVWLSCCCVIVLSLCGCLVAVLIRVSVNGSN